MCWGLTTRQPLWVILREREKRGRRDKRRDEREGQGRKRNRNESKETEEITFGEKNQQQVRQIKEYTRGTKKKKKKKKCTTTRTEFSQYMLVSAPTADRIKLNEKKKKGLFTIA